MSTINPLNTSPKKIRGRKPAAGGQAFLPSLPEPRESFLRTGMTAALEAQSMLIHKGIPTLGQVAKATIAADLGPYISPVLQATTQTLLAMAPPSHSFRGGRPPLIAFAWGSLKGSSAGVKGDLARVEQKTDEIDQFARQFAAQKPLFFEPVPELVTTTSLVLHPRHSASLLSKNWETVSEQVLNGKPQPRRMPG